MQNRLGLAALLLLIMAIVLITLSPEEGAEPSTSEVVASEGGGERSLVGHSDPVRVQVDSGAASRSAIDSSPSRDSGSIHCTVVGPNELPVEGVSIEVRRGKETVTKGTSNREGRIDFVDLAVGEYRLLVVEPLPKGYLMPWRQDLRASWSNMPSVAKAMRGFYATDVSLGPSDHAEATLRVFKAGKVIGMVVGPKGEAVAEVDVRIGSRVPETQQLTFDTRTDVRGEFSFSGVYPGSYRIQVELLNAEVGYRDMTLPISADFDVLEGVDASPLIIQLHNGPHSVRGRVINQDEEPVADLGVMIYLDRNRYDRKERTSWADMVARTKTDSDGNYELAGLIPGYYSLNVGDGDDYDVHRMDCRLAWWVQPEKLEILSSRLDMDIGTTEVLENHPFTLTGKVEIHSPGVRMDRVSLAFIKRSIIDSARRSSTGRPMPEGVIPRGIPPKENGEFKLQIRSPGPPQYLLVYLRGVIEKVIPIEVVPGGTAFQLISF